MNEQLVKFIKLCLVDGIITNKEREVIFRKSKELGIPDDECEIILEGMKSKYNLSNKKKSELEKDNEDEIYDSEKIDINTRELLNEYSELTEIKKRKLNTLLEKSSSIEKFWSNLNRFKKLSVEEVNKIKSNLNINHNFDCDLFLEKNTGWYFTKFGELLFTFGEQGLKSTFKSKYYMYWSIKEKKYVRVPEIKSQGNFFKKTYSIEVGYEKYIGVHDTLINHTKSLLKEYNDYLEDSLKISNELLKLKEEINDLVIKYEYVKQMGEIRNKILIKYNKDEISRLKKYPDDVNIIVRKHQNKFSNEESLNLVQVKERLTEIIIELDHLYNFICNYDLRNSSSPKKTSGIIIPDQKNHYSISELIHEFEEGMFNYSQIYYYTLCMITSMIEGDKITFMEIYLKFDKIGVFNSNWENKMLEGVSSIEDKIDNLTKSVNIMNSSISSKLNSLYHLTESSFESLQETVSSELKSINSSVKFNNLLSGIQTYQLYKINKQTK
jgi:hypothetical protein